MSAAADSATLRLAVFTALAAFAAAHWAALVTSPPIGRAMFCVLVVSAGGAALVLTGRAPFGSLGRNLLAAFVALGALVAALAVIGMPVRLLVPWHWGELGDALYTGFEGIEDVDYPYAGQHPWSRLVILLALPVSLAAAAALAFWPLRERGSLRTVALAIVVGVYAIAVITDSASHPLLRGTVLFLLVAAWLWLPRVGRRQVLACSALIAVSGLLAVPVASALNAQNPWLNYRDWRLDFSSGRGSGETFNWDHSYGPLDWARTGKQLLEVRSDSPHYWRAAVLDSFDGFRWRSTGDIEDPTIELPGQGPIGPPQWEGIEPDWMHWIGFRVEALRSPAVVAAGPVQTVRGSDVFLGLTGVSASNGALEEGDSYALRTYVPAPSKAQMRSAPEIYQPALDQFRSIDDPAPYGRVYALARSWTAGAATVYDAVEAIEARLESGYEYSEDPPDRRYPLRAFLFADRVGYCQQFSGAMALMLRLLGIPSRVAAGFSPGERNGDRFVVRDSDAHSWVEVYFSGIGWVTFDPTPSDAPAQSQSAGLSTPPPPLPLRPAPSPRRQGADPRSPKAPPEESSGGVALWIPGAAIAAALLFVAVPATFRRRRCRILSGRALAGAQLRELEEALRRLGRPVANGMTLRGLERRHGRRTALAAYAEKLRAVRYGPGGPEPPTLAQRRRVRRELSSRGGLRARLRALLAIPPGGPSLRVR